MDKLNKLPDIKAGYLLVVDDGVERYNMTVIPNCNGKLGCCCPQKNWLPIGWMGEVKIMEVWGPAPNRWLLDNSTVERELLWRRYEETNKETDVKTEDRTEEEELYRVAARLIHIITDLGFTISIYHDNDIKKEDD